MNAIDWEIALKLFLGMIFGGIIGLEREIGNRPAGFRTHTLVCMGSVLVMLTSEYLFNTYHSVTNLDPGRLGAQVISGIGFLGAGTIMKDGSRVRGLTTAASLWVVACIGLATGVGFYWGALTATILSYITLVLLKKFEGHMPGVRDYEIHMDIRNVPGQIVQITNVLAALNIRIRHIHVEPGEEEVTQAYFRVTLPQGLNRKTLVGELARLDGVRVTEEDEME